MWIRSVAPRSESCYHISQHHAWHTHISRKARLALVFQEELVTASDLPRCGKFTWFKKPAPKALGVFSQLCACLWSSCPPLCRNSQEVSEKPQFIKIWVLNNAGMTCGASPCPACASAAFRCQPVAGRGRGDGALPVLAEG